VMTPAAIPRSPGLPRCPSALARVHHPGAFGSGLKAHDGQVVDTQGDAFFAVFSSPRASVVAAVEMQQTLGQRTHSQCVLKGEFALGGAQ